LAFDLKEEFSLIYESQDRASAEKAFINWKQSIPSAFDCGYGDVVKMVERHHQNIFNYFDCPITNGYTEAVNGVMKAANRLGRGYSYEVIRAKMLYSKLASQAGQIISHSGKVTDIAQPDSTWGTPYQMDYGASISTLVDEAEKGVAN